jgi:hypothetical protein
MKTELNSDMHGIYKKCYDTKWENFSKVIDRAMLAYKNIGFNVGDHFPDVRKTIQMPVTSVRATIS